MVCEHCGAEIQPGASFCMNCGAPVSAGNRNLAPVPAPAPAPAPMLSTPSGVTASNVLTWGILSLAFACTFILSFLGIIFGVTGKKKAEEYQACFGTVSGQANTGRILSRVGFIVGIVMTVLFVLYMIFLVAMVMFAVM